MSEKNVTTSGPVDPGPHRSPTPEIHATYTSLEILVALVAIVGNAMVIHVFRRDRRLRRRTNYYIVSLAIADLLVGLFGIPFAILASVGLPRNLYACLFTTSILVMLCTISIFCLVGVSVDRYWAILYPMCYSRNVRTKTAILLAFADAKISGGPRGRFDKLPNGTYHHVSARHAHYSYHPPSRIYFLCRRCSNFVAYPVFHGLPPTYVYKYREFGGRFSELLTGLALYNLGRASVDHWEYSHYYPMSPDEKCCLQVVDRKHFEEVKVPCFILSSFVERSPESYLPGPNALDISSPQIDIRPFLPHDSSTMKVTRDQDCILWHNNTLNKHRYTVPCALLMQYSETMKPSGIPVYVWLPSTLALVITIYMLCHCCCKRRVKKEAVPINSGLIQPRDYCTNY